MLPYLTKLSIAVMVVFLFYHFLLRRLTFYRWNRWYLLMYAACCFFIPFIDINPFLQSNQLDSSALVGYIPTVNGERMQRSIAESQSWLQAHWIWLLFLSGILILSLRMIVQHVSLFRMRQAARLLVSDRIKLYQVNKPIIPFSYGNAIYVNQNQHTEEELKEIIRHEFIHVKQGHTFDMLFAEIFCILNWYNPFAWLLRHAIRQNLEFIADQEVLEKGVDKKQYQYLLLKVIGISQYSIATNFNFSSLKKRIAMMNRMRTAKVHLLKFLFLLPVLLVLLVSFRQQLLTNNDVSDSYTYTDTVPTAKQIGKKLPDNVRSIKVQNDRITVLLKDGTQEVYDQHKPEDVAAFEKKYGALPPPPPPPVRPSAPSSVAPAPPPPPVAPRSGVSSPAAPSVPAVPTLPSQQDWVKASVNKKGYILSVADNNGECVVIIKNRSGKIEKSMLMTDWTANEKANEARYGSIPPPPPPTPAPAQAPKFGVKDPGAIPAPGADAGIIQAPAEGYYLKADKIEYTPGAKGSKESIRLSGTNGVIVKGQTNALIVIDGVVQEGQGALSRLNPDQISQIEVLKNESATAIYGEKGRNGVLLISTKKDASDQPLLLQPARAAETREELPLKSKTLAEVKGDATIAFYVVDGKEYTVEGFKRLNLEGSAINSIHVWKGDAAVKQFGERGRAGVIEVKTK